ncbi:MAG: FAD-dependent oxidoreductase, partial [Candidatus Omnitrophica bacterium]|nr:FAD-dependent oxidoreductase [Candidatus Omnitrophota bacterium]
MAKIVIIGGGFAGLAAVEQLCSMGLRQDLVLIDKKETFDFLPLLPDTLGRDIPPEALTLPFALIARSRGFSFIPAEVTEVSFPHKQVVLSQKRIPYEYLVIACGSQTNFYGNENIAESALTLDNADDARRLQKTLTRGNFDTILIAGAGYTGIEAATSLRRWSQSRSKRQKIVIIERAPDILGPLPVWMKEYVKANLVRLDISCVPGSTIERIEGRRVFLSAGKVFEDSLVIWGA